MKTSWSKKACMALLAIAASSPALGQVHQAGTYYETSASKSCTAVMTCFLRFPQLPADKLVMFEKVHCYVERSLGLKVASLGITETPAQTTFKRRVILQASLQSVTDKNNYTIDNDVHFLVGQGRYINVLVETSQITNGLVICTLIGRTMANVPTD